MRDVNRSSLIPVITVIIGIFMIGFALLIGFDSNRILTQATATPSMQTQDVPRISPSEAMNAMDSGSAIFVDVRDYESFMSGHIPGALSIPLNEIQTRLDEIPVDKLIIPY